MIAALQEVATSARAAGIRLGLENHNHGAFTPTAAEFLRVLREADSPDLVPLVDTGNFVDGWPSLTASLPMAAQVHAKFWEVNADGSDARVDYARIVPLLRAANYRGWITFEYEAEEAEATGAPRALAYLRRLLDYS
jgi:sugar phosphate isomerase/epimerase